MNTDCFRDHMPGKACRLFLFAACFSLSPAWTMPAAFGAELSPPEPPTEMQSFAFLLGKWGCDGVWQTGEEGARSFGATWEAHEILGGHVIIEEYRSFWPDGETFVYGTNFRTYDAANGTWIVKWHSVLDGTGFDLGQPQFGQSENGTPVITFLIKADANWQRAIYKNINANRFTWQGDASADAGATWDEAFMVIDCNRES